GGHGGQGRGAGKTGGGEGRRRLDRRRRDRGDRRRRRFGRFETVGELSGAEAQGDTDHSQGGNRDNGGSSSPPLAEGRRVARGNNVVGLGRGHGAGDSF